MCVSNDPEATRNFRRRTKLFKAYKVLTMYGTSPLMYSCYGPGLCCAPGIKKITKETFKKYHKRPFGLHLYHKKEAALEEAGIHYVVLEVLVDPKKVIAASRSYYQNPHSDINQLAVTQFKIPKKTWDEAGLPSGPSLKRIIK